MEKENYREVPCIYLTRQLWVFTNIFFTVPLSPNINLWNCSILILIQPTRLTQIFPTWLVLYVCVLCVYLLWTLFTVNTIACGFLYSPPQGDTEQLQGHIPAAATRLPVASGLQPWQPPTCPPLPKSNHLKALRREWYHPKPWGRELQRFFYWSNQQAGKTC